MNKISTKITVFISLLSIFSTMVLLAKTQTIEWSEPKQLTADPRQDYTPSIMQDSNGLIWLVWARSVPGMTGDLWHKTSSNGGISWSDSSILVADTLQESDKTSLLQDSTGRIWVAWASGQYSPYIDWDIFYITSDDGLSWSPRKQLTDYPGDDTSPSIIEVSGEVWIVFRRSHDVWYRKTADGGNTWSPPIQLTSHSLQSFNSAAIIDSTGKIWIAWSRNRDIYYKTSSDNGTSWSTDQRLTNHPNWETQPSIIEHVSGKIFIFYSIFYNGEPDDIWYKTTLDGGDNWSPPQDEENGNPLTTDDYVNTALNTALINNEVWVVWSSDRSGNIDIWMSNIVSVPATIDLDPDTLNLKSNGQWITCYIELPEGYVVSDIDVNSILLNDTIPVDIEGPITVGDYDMDDIPDLMFKFDRATVISWLGTIDYGEDTGKYCEINLALTGTVAGTQFSGTDKITVLKK